MLSYYMCVQRSSPSSRLTMIYTRVGTGCAKGRGATARVCPSLHSQRSRLSLVHLGRSKDDLPSCSTMKILIK